MNNSELLERFRELEARLQKVNTELDGLRVAIKGRTFTEKKVETPTKVYEVGEYVRVKPYQSSDEFAGIITHRHETPKGFLYDVYGKDKAAIYTNIDMLEEWMPKKGEMCIFWDDDISESIIAIFHCYYFGDICTYMANCTKYLKCIPFLSEQQYKRYINYEK